MIICFEGVSCAGKSTLISKINLCLVGTVVIPELPSDFARHKNLDDFCRYNDERKCKASSSYPLGKIVLQDRGHASTLAYNYIQYRLGISTEYTKTLSWYYKSLLENRLIKPDLYIFIKADKRTVIKRAKSLNRFKQTIAWYSDPDLGNDFYEYFFQICEPDVPVIEIDASKNLKTKVADTLLGIKNYAT